jgi:tetratricopeptide (TPR) repeat protein
VYKNAMACALTVLTAIAGPLQVDEWRRQVDRGNAAQKMGNYADAAASYELAVHAAEPFNPGDSRRSLALNAAATMYDALGRFADAEATYRLALAAAQTGGERTPEYALILSNLGTVYAEMGQLSKAEKMLRDALATYDTVERPDAGLHRAMVQNALGEVLSISARYPEADQLLTTALAVLEKHPEAWSETSMAKNDLAVVRFYQKNFPESLRLFEESITGFEAHMGPDHPMLVRTLNNYACVQGLTGQREKAGETLRRAVDIAEKRLGQEHPLYGMVLASYAAHVREAGDKKTAKVLAAKSSKILRETGRRNGLGAVIDVNALRSK